MKKSEIYRKLIVSVIALCGLSIGLMAQPGDRGPRSRPGSHQRTAMLNLSEEQKSEIKQIRVERARETQPLKDELRINNARINAQMHKDNPDMKEIVGLVEANGKILTQIRLKEIDSRIKIRGLLSDEQKVLFDEGEHRMQRHRQIAEYRQPRHFPGNSDTGVWQRRSENDR
jgi:Spy/CpxP family protein refolding chaperone